MGAVYAGFDTEAKEFVAIKTLFQEMADDETVVGLFGRECQVSSLLDHPNIVRYFGDGDHEGTRYLALEYVRGTTLADLLRTRGRLNAAEVVELLEDAAGGLKSVHNKVVVHRDLKPENLIINQDGILKIIDFGIAIVDHEDPFAREGLMVGTFTYASPEQNMGQDIGEQADIYSLGAIAWHCLVGRRWAQGGSAFEVGLAQMSGAPEAPGSLVEGVPPRLDAIILKCMASEATDRYRDAEALLDELRDFREEEERKDATDNIFADPIAGKWSVAKRSFYQKRYALSKSLARYIADRKPDFAPVHFLLGKLFATEGREFNSTDSFRKAIELDPTNYEYYADFALSLVRLNMFRLAKPELEALIAKAPDHALGAGFLELVEENLAADVAADPRRAEAEAEPDAAAAAMAAKQADLQAVTGEDPAAPAADGDAADSGSALPEGPDERPVMDPREILGASAWFPGLGRMAYGDLTGGLLRAALGAAILGLAYLTVTYPPVGSEAWQEMVQTFVIDHVTEVSSEIDPWTTGLLTMSKIGRALGLVVLAVGFLWFRSREATAAFHAGARAIWRGQVVAQLAEGRVKVNLGRERGVEEGQIFDVHRLMQRSSTSLKLGQIKIESVADGESMARYRADVGVTDDPAVGDQIRASDTLLGIKPRDER